MVQHPGLWVPTSFLIGSESMNLTVPQLTNSKLANRVPDNSVMIACSYMGYQTEREINGQPSVEEPSVLSEAYQKGVAAAVDSAPTDPWQPQNPYQSATNDPHVVADNAEWERGFKSIRALQEIRIAREAANPTAQVHRENQPTALLEEAPKQGARSAKKE